MAEALRLPSPSPSTMNDTSGILALYRLLGKASSLPCSSGAAAFLSLIPSENNWFPLALEALLPALQDQNIQPPQRILAAYLLDALYASHDHLNPFHDHILQIFESERAAAVIHSRSFDLVGSPELGLGPPQEGGSGLQAENEQLVWVLWKILKGEGEHLGPYSPNILSRTALPEHLRAQHLVLQVRPDHSPDVPIHTLYSLNMDIPEFTHQLTTTATSQNHATHFESEPSPSAPLSQYAFPTSPARAPSTSSFSPFDDEPARDLRSPQYQKSPGRAEAETEGWLREVVPVVPSEVHQKQYQRSPDFSRVASAQSSPQEATLPSPTELRLAPAEQRRQALLRALCEEPQAQGEMGELPYLRGGVSGSETEAIRNNVGGGMRYEPSQVTLRTHTQPQPQHSPFSHRHQPLQPQPQFPTSRLDVQGHFNQYESASTNTPFLTSFAASINTTTTRQGPGPIARPRPAPSLYYTSAPYAAAPAPQSAFANGLAPQQVQMQLADVFPRQTPTNGFSQQILTPPASGFAQQTRIISTPNGPSQKARTPGVIGSGRPSESTSKSVSPVTLGSLNGSSAADRRPHVGVIGNGRPVPSAATGDGSEASVGEIARENMHDGMMPWSVLRPEKSSGEGVKNGFGVIGRPKSDLREEGETAVEPRAIGFGEATRMDAGSLGVARGTTFVEALSAKVTKTSLESQRRATGSISPVNRGITQPAVASLVIPSHAAAQPKTSSLNTHSISALARSLEIGVKFDEREPTSSSQRHPSFSPSTSPCIERPQPSKPSEVSHLPQVRDPAQRLSAELEIDQKERDELSRAILLLLSARERVLTLPEQRMLLPHLPMLTRPLSLLRPGDLPPLVAKNPDVAVRLLVLILDRNDDDSTRIERVLKDLSKNNLFRLEYGSDSEILSSTDTASFDSMGAVDVIQTAIEFVRSGGESSSTATSESSGQRKVSPFGGRETREGYLNALRKLPPMMQSFNLVAKLLHPTPLAAAIEPSEQGTPEVRVAKLVRAEVLGGLVSGCVQWIEHAEQGEKEGEILDDRVAIAVSSLSRFYSSLLKHGFVSAASEVDTTEIMSFALQFSRFEEARSLYSTLAAARA